MDKYYRVTTTPSVRRKVEKIIKKDPAIRKNLARGIINQRALARYLKNKIEKETEKEITLDAVISGIRRYPIEEDKGPDKAEKIIKKMKISTKNKISDLTLKNSSGVHRLLGKIASSVDFSSGETLRIIVALQGIKIILDEESKDDILDMIPDHNVIGLTENLSEISILLPEETKRTPGIASKITNEFALNNINIVELMSSIPELIFIIDEKNTRKAYRVLEELSS